MESQSSHRVGVGVRGVVTRLAGATKPDRVTQERAESPVATQPHPVAITRGLLTPSSVPGRNLEGRRRGPGVLVAWTLHPPQQRSQMQRWEAQVSRTEDLGVA